MSDITIGGVRGIDRSDGNIHLELNRFEAVAILEALIFLSGIGERGHGAHATQGILSVLLEEEEK